MNILYVENHAVFADTVTKEFLSQHSVTIVPTLQAALQAVLEKSFDLALVDYDLDDGKGDELVRLLRRSENPITVIGVSSHERGNAAILEAGAAMVCDKGRFHQIQAVIEAAMRDRGD